MIVALIVLLPVLGVVALALAAILRNFVLYR